MVRMVKRESIMVFLGKAYCKFLTFIGSSVNCPVHCNNGGHCSIDSNSNAFCKCPINFTGDFCEEVISSGNNVLPQISSVLQHYL